MGNMFNERIGRMTGEILISLTKGQSELIRSLLYRHIQESTDDTQTLYANLLVSEFEQAEGELKGGCGE